MVRLWRYKRLRSDSDDAGADDCRAADGEAVDYAKSNKFGRKKVSAMDHNVPANICQSILTSLTAAMQCKVT